MSSSESEGIFYHNDDEEYDDEDNDEEESDPGISGLEDDEEDDDGERGRRIELERVAHCMWNLSQGSYDDAIKSAISIYVPNELAPFIPWIQIREVENLKGQLRASVTLGAVECLSMTLKAHPNLERIELSNCSIGNNVDIILAILQSDVRYINLNFNGIGSPGAEVISGYLETNPPIHELDIDYNEFNEDDAVLFSQALRRNTNLLEFYARQSARGTNFSIAGIKSLIKSVFDSTCLNSVAESNHRCKLNLFPLSSDLRDHVEMINETGLFSQIEIKKRKLLIALRERESLLRYLEVPVELMPEVLCLILGEENGKKRINMIYEIMRWWSMPSLYSYHHQSCSRAVAKRKRDEYREREVQVL
mmetsp:Transcript_39665/g.72631  ORF Transcript_39665/g.72631 Transcript_39665/m.72631 type:complete len:363 (-) Transcript_39665:703-1791(-)|eukprot:CAMPEP_0201878764 /NCGR_PEP_ID=MMETSP0902-20130614/9839_1 /ASSEMBLY_ACC=CAM_ASM_000551 /TAXON_ID=420261 /ORGANISM="Thalassiosira antarctica, Strain CCMP982" /LENGTH=362 /DNA_ID=CAMNT_0048406455 /DNA_START=124 /DNA_END=1212 /DNA_ORIENTATION=+